MKLSISPTYLARFDPFFQYQLSSLQLRATNTLSSGNLLPFIIKFLMNIILIRIPCNTVSILENSGKKGSFRRLINKSYNQPDIPYCFVWLYVIGQCSSSTRGVNRILPARAAIQKRVVPLEQYK